MKSLSFVILVLATAWMLATNAAANPADADVRPAFFLRLQALADKTDLFDPVAVATVLGTTLQTTTSTRSDSCYQSNERSPATTIHAVPDGAWWYRVLPTGVRNMPIPAFMINLASTSSDASFDYKIVKRQECPGTAVRERTEANLGFGGLPSFACITQDDIRRLLPAAQLRMATDGVFFFTYEGHPDDHAATQLDFAFRAGAPCALGASLYRQVHR